jgi:hypothetical protein
LDIKGVDGQISFDGKNVIITRRGIFGSAAGFSNKIINVKQIEMITLKDATSFINGYIFFVTADSGLVSGTFASHENLVVFKKPKQKDFEEFKQAVSQAMATSKSRVTLSSKLLTSDLSELVDMFKSGKISKEEFDSQKEILIENL